MTVVVGLALAVGLVIASLLGVSDVLRVDILNVLEHKEPPEQSGGLGIVHRPPTEVTLGMVLAVYILLLGSIPAAVLGTALAARQRKRPERWPGEWGSALFGGLVFQLCSLMSTAFLLLLLLVAAYTLAGPQDVAVFGGVLVVNLACGLWGLRSWRALQLAVHGAPMTIAPR